MERSNWKQRTQIGALLPKPLPEFFKQSKLQHITAKAVSQSSPWHFFFPFLLLLVFLFIFASNSSTCQNHVVAEFGLDSRIELRKMKSVLNLLVSDCRKPAMNAYVNLYISIQLKIHYILNMNSDIISTSNMSS